MTKTKKVFCALGVLLLAVLLMGCAANGPISGTTTAVVGGIGGVAIAILDSLLAQGVIDPQQYHGLANGIGSLAAAAQQAAAGVDDVRRGLGQLGEQVATVKATADSAITTGDAMLVAGGAGAVGSGAWWQAKRTKRAG